jgi:hypothetical protein
VLLAGLVVNHLVLEQHQHNFYKANGFKPKALFFLHSLKLKQQQLIIDS